MELIQINSRPVCKNMKIYDTAFLIIEFESDNEEYIYWQLDERGTIIKTWPFGNDIWEGKQVDLKTLKTNQNLHILYAKRKIEIDNRVLNVSLIK